MWLSVQTAYDILTGHLRTKNTVVTGGVDHHGMCTETHVWAICVHTLSTHTHRRIQTLIDVCRKKNNTHTRIIWTFNRVSYFLNRHCAFIRSKETINNHSRFVFMSWNAAAQAALFHVANHFKDKQCCTNQGLSFHLLWKSIEFDFACWNRNCAHGGWSITRYI